MSRPSDGPTSLVSAATGAEAAPDLSVLEHAFEAIARELALIAGSPQCVDEATTLLRTSRWAWALPSIETRFSELASVVKRAPRASTPSLVSVLFDVAANSESPWRILAPLAGSSDPCVRHESFDCVRHLVEEGRLRCDDELFETIAAIVESGPDALRAEDALRDIATVLDAAPAGGVSLEQLWTSSSRPHTRRLAARLLDLSSELPHASSATALLGAPLTTFLEPYLAYTRANHLDLAELVLGTGDRETLLHQLRSAEADAGQPLLREVLGELGWKSVNGGLVVTRAALLSVAGSFPLALEPAQAALLDGCPAVELLGERLVFIATGGDATDRESKAPSSSAVDRFRACNLRHADVLADLLDVGPLTREKVVRMCGRMDAIVDDFCTLFDGHTDECGTIRETYARLRQDIAQQLADARPDQPMPAGVTRLVQMFEDPTSAADIHTLHGCKRYLHQRGLRLGFKLAEAGRSTNRAITLALANTEHLVTVLRAIEYVDFEPSDESSLPHLVRVGVDAYTRHLLHGETSFPKLRFFCYGNEVHCFATFRNHPAFIRVDFSPPQRGGMVDLEYCGVSKFDLDWHPNPSLTAIETVFRRFDFDISVTDTRIRARYDKERASNLQQLSEKIEGLFRLVPVLMDVDWIIGDLQISPAARHDVAAAWAEFFQEWGILPMRHVLTGDKLGILVGMQEDPAGVHEIRWTGTDPYHDRFSVTTPPEFWLALRRRLAEQGIAHLVSIPAEGPVSQGALESLLLNPIRRALQRGEIALTSDGYVPEPPSTYRGVHEARLMAEVLGSTDDVLASSVRLARLVAMLEGTLRFDVTGTINGYEVQRATLSLPGHTATLCGLRDGSGIMQAALFVDADKPYERRPSEDAAWTRNWTWDAETLSAVLRRSNYAPPWTEPPSETAGTVAARVRRAFASQNAHGRSVPLPGERIVNGLKASPGRAVATARIGLQRRRPADLSGSIIVESALSPSDNPFVFRSAGIITTGGGILSHAGLLALQFRKPAIVVAGRLEEEGADRLLVCTRLSRRDVRVRVGEYDVIEQHDVTALEERVCDGDVVVVDADAGTLLVLGQHPDTLALHAELRHLAASAQRVQEARSDAELLAQRGAMLRARHQLERLLARIHDPVLARHAVTELLSGEAGTDPAVASADKARLLLALCGNERVAGTARAAVRELRQRVSQRLALAHAEATQAIPSSPDALEVLALRLSVRRLAGLLQNVDGILVGAAIAPAVPSSVDLESVDALACERLLALRGEALAAAAAQASRGGPVRHILKDLSRLSSALGNAASTAALETGRTVEDATGLALVREARVLGASDGGAELLPLIGGKASNLAEAYRLGARALIPPWFVVTDRAFRDVLSRPVPDEPHVSSLAAFIDRALAVRDSSAAQQAAVIRRAWESVDLPAELETALEIAYRELAAAGPAGGIREAPDDDPGQPFVAVRSSAREEDAEDQARAGEFDTFLFVRGRRSIGEHLKRAWSGLWNERAIHNRAVIGGTGEIGGGILVQRMVWARVSGVLHTANIAGGQWREMVINAGLGLGEGIVSGAVAADQVIVSKDGLGSGRPLQFRYIANDKRERVVFDRNSGSGTRLVETLYHQRLRPALEYVELCELVEAAARLESGFRQPLDIEFAFAGEHLWLLQVRPIPAAHALWRETIEHHPLGRRPS